MMAGKIGAAIEDVYIDLGRWLREKREELDLTQLDASVMLGLSRPSLANIEAGRQRLYHHQVIEMQARMTPEGVAEYREAYERSQEDEILAAAERIKERRKREGRT